MQSYTFASREWDYKRGWINYHMMQRVFLLLLFHSLKLLYEAKSYIIKNGFKRMDLLNLRSYWLQPVLSISYFRL